MWPRAHAHHMAVPHPAPIQWNQTLQTRPGVPHRTAVMAEPLSAASQFRTQWGHLWEQPRAARPAYLKGARVSSDTSHEGSPAAPPPSSPDASTGCSLGLNRESYVSSLAPCPDSHIFCRHQHWWAQQRIPVPGRRQNGECILSLEILLPSALLELIQFTTGSYGDQQWMSTNSEATVAPAVPRNCKIFSS